MGLANYQNKHNQDFRKFSRKAKGGSLREADFHKWRLVNPDVDNTVTIRYIEPRTIEKKKYVEQIEG